MTAFESRKTIQAASTAQLLIWLSNLDRVEVSIEFRQLVAEELDRRREAGGIGVLSSD